MSLITICSYLLAYRCITARPPTHSPKTHWIVNPNSIKGSIRGLASYCFTPEECKQFEIWRLTYSYACARFSVPARSMHKSRLAHWTREIVVSRQRTIWCINAPYATELQVYLDELWLLLVLVVVALLSIVDLEHECDNEEILCILGQNMRCWVMSLTKSSWAENVHYETDDANGRGIYFACILRLNDR